MPDDFIRLNIAIRPPTEVGKNAIKISQSINQQTETFFVLSGTNFHPHITLYSTEFPHKNLANIQDKLAAIVSQNKPFTCHFTKLDYHEGYIDIEIETNQQLKQLHQQIVTHLNPLREGHLRSKYQSKSFQKNLTSDQIKNIKDYGYPDVINLFRPHLTFTRIKDPHKSQAIANNLIWDNSRFKLDTIGLFLMSDHGTCVEKINEFHLLSDHQ